MRYGYAERTLEQEAAVADSAGAIGRRVAEQRARALVLLVVPDRRQIVGYQVAEILPLPVDNAARRDATAGVDRHRAIQVVAWLIPQIALLAQLAGVQLPVGRVDRHPFILGRFLIRLALQLV